MTDHQDFEREFGGMLRQAGDSFEPDTQTLVAGGVRRGRARQWRQRAGIASGAASAAAIAIAALYLPGTGGDSTRPAEVPRTGPDMISALMEELPEDLTYDQVQGSGSATQESPSASLVVDDGSGGLGIDLSLGRWQDSGLSGGALDCGFGEPGYDCTEQELADGSVLTLMADTSDPVSDPGDEDYDFGGVHSWNAWLIGPGGAELDEPGLRAVTLTLTKFFDDDIPSGYQPPIGLERMAEVVQAEVWQDIFDELDEKYGAPGGFDPNRPSSQVASAELLTAFRDVLPHGVEVVGEESHLEPGSAGTVIDDGQGPARVDITLWSPGWFPEEGYGFEELEEDRSEEDGCGFETAPGDIRVSSCYWPPERDDPQASWSVWAYYPDGGGMEINQLNGEDYGDDPVRQDAPLTMEELKQIALADVWQELLGAE